jgi:hypothetical protein
LAYAASLHPLSAQGRVHSLQVFLLIKTTLDYF